MAELTRNSVVAIKEEVTEGTPVLPSAGTDFIAIQDDFQITPSFETLENAEIRANIGLAKSIQGLEVPTATLSHYLRHSGVEAQAPNYSLLLKGAFGSVAVNSTEYNTVSGSTTTVVNVDTGEGANFGRGHGLLIKDGVNGYSIRPVQSVSGDALTLGFALANAPGTGVNLGKAVKYTPANTGHPSLTLSDYRSNGGALQVLSGAKVTSFSFDASAGELVNASYSLEGIKYHFDPINITSTDIYLDFLDDATTRAAVVTAKLYKDPHELADALASAMNSLGSGNTFTVTYNDSDGKFTIASDGTTLSLLWNSGANTANTIGDKIGFVTAADDTGALTYTSDNAQSWATALTPSYDSADPLVAKNNEVLLGGQLDSVCFEASSISVSLDDTRTLVESICAETGVSGSLITQRSVTVDLTATLTRHEADKFKRFRENEETRFMYAFGTKSGGNWVAGKSGMFYMASAVISSFEVADADGLVVLNLSLAGFIDNSGNNEVYLNFL